MNSRDGALRVSEVTKLLEELSLLGVRIEVEDQQVKLNAPKGVLTAALRGRLLENKAEIIAEIGRGTSSHEARPAIVADRSNDLAPFALADLQLGFYLADDPFMEFHVRPHAYLEMDFERLDVTAYARAWNTALRRHRRELCIVNSSVELQMIPQLDDVVFREDDLCERTAQQVHEHLAQVRAEMERRELPLDRWPWFELRISTWMEHGVRKSRVHYNHNNFFIDGFGTSRLLEEIDAYYRDATLVRPALEISYRDAVLALEKLAESSDGEKAREYWFGRLADLPSPPAIPLAANLNRRRRSFLERRSGGLDKQSWDAFKKTAASHGITPSNAVVAAYAQVLATWSNSDHFILSQMATRRFSDLHPQMMDLLGNFVSLYPLEIELQADESFVDNALRIQQRLSLDLEHLQLGGMRVLEKLNRLQGSLGTAPSPFVVGSGLALRNYRKGFQTLETSQTILDNQFFEIQDGSLYVVWDLIEQCFPAGLIDDMWSAFDHLLRTLASEPRKWSDRHFDLVAQRNTEHDTQPSTAPLADRKDVPGACLHDALGEQAGNGKLPALINHQGVLGYAQLDEWSSSLAARLIAEGIGSHSIVAIVMDRGWELCVATLAVLKTGAAYVPVDPSQPAERADFMLKDCRVEVALTQSRYRNAIDWLSAVSAMVVDLPPSPMAADEKRSMPAVSSGDLAYVIYTSGTTGNPKGVMIEHGAAMNTITDLNSRFAVTSSDRIFGVSAFSFDLSVYDIFGALAAGASLVYPGPDAAWDPDHWLELLQRERVTIWSSVPALMSLLVEAAQKRAVKLPALRLVMLSGDKIPLGLPDAVRAIAPSAVIVSLGGATEVSIWSILYHIDAVDPAWSTIPYGYPLRGQFWKVLDRHGRPCPRWVRGELYIGGRGLARGYLNDAEKTNARFIRDSDRGERLYRTGDLGRYIADDCIEWMGRADFQIKIAGHRIEPAEIEAALGEHPDIEEAVVTVGTTHGGRQVLVAHVSCGAGAAPSVQECERFLRNKLPAYMVPVAWHFLPRLPVTSNGKIDRKALMQAHAGTAPASAAQKRYEPPAKECERQLCALWQQILAVAEVGVTDDFFELGGQSFDAVRLFAAIKQTFGRVFSLADIWSARNVRELARRMESEQEAQQGCTVVAINAGRSGAPLFLVHPAGGSVLGYAALGRQLHRPLYGLGITADSQIVAERRDIAKLAAAHLTNLRGIQSRGPYSLGGWSSGAMIAFEMAAQLEAAGESVQRVFLLDGPTPMSGPPPHAQELLAWFIQDLGLDLPVEQLLDATANDSDIQERLRHVTRLAQLDDAVDLVPAFTIFADVVGAGRRYSPGVVHAPLTIVRVEADIVAEFAGHPQCQAPDWGWQRHTRGAVQCLRVAGTHYNFLGESRIHWADQVMHG